MANQWINCLIFFLLGIILHEMISGSRPFSGETSADLISSILRDQPALVSDLNAELPRQLGRIISRCLEKNAQKTYTICDRFT